MHAFRGRIAANEFAGMIRPYVRRWMPISAASHRTDAACCVSLKTCCVSQKRRSRLLLYYDTTIRYNTHIIIKGDTR